MNPLRTVAGRLALALVVVVGGALGIVYLIVVPAYSRSLLERAARGHPADASRSSRRNRAHVGLARSFRARPGSRTRSSCWDRPARARASSSSTRLRCSSRSPTRTARPRATSRTTRSSRRAATQLDSRRQRRGHPRRDALRRGRGLARARPGHPAALDVAAQRRRSLRRRPPPGDRRRNSRDAVRHRARIRARDALRAADPTARGRGRAHRGRRLRRRGLGRGPRRARPARARVRPDARTARLARAGARRVHRQRLARAADAPLLARGLPRAAERRGRARPVDARGVPRHDAGAGLAADAACDRAARPLAHRRGADDGRERGRRPGRGRSDARLRLRAARCRRGHELAFDGTTSRWSRAADEERILQIGRILVENAIVHTRPGTTVTVAVTSSGPAPRSGSR